MRIPADAIIPFEKLTAYLLVAREWDDKSKFEYGVFLRAEGALTGPNGQALAVVTIWLQSRADGQTRFVTLKPRREKRS